MLFNFSRFIGLLLLISYTLFMSAEAKTPTFEGAWESCFRFTKRDGDNYGIYGGGKICTNFLLRQKGNRVCGFWTYFATHYYSGKIQATLLSPSTARSVRMCGREGDYTKTPCSIETKFPSVDKAYKEWESNKRIWLTRYRNRLFADLRDNKIEDQSSTYKKKRNLADGFIKRKFTSEELLELKQDKSIEQCLNGEE